MYRENVRKTMWMLDHTPMPAHYGGTVISPLHYGDTVEIVLTRGIEGEFMTNGKKYALQDKNVFFLPPRQLHSFIFLSGGANERDMIAAFHISIEALSPYLDLKKLLLADNRTLQSIPTVCGGFDTVYGIILAMLDEGQPFSTRICHLLRLFECLRGQSNSNAAVANDCFQASRIVDWIESNYAGKPTVEAAAEHFGYSKHYFCKWIKENTGSTFHEILDAVRINHACLDLIDGVSISETAERCGYSDPSYFIKVFKKLLNVTPKVYAAERGE